VTPREGAALTLARAMDAWTEAGAELGAGALHADGRLSVRVKRCELLDLWREGGPPAGWTLVQRGCLWHLWHAAPV
jgi:hypothetical protein